MPAPTEAISAILFDLDGVLVDSETAVLGLWQRIAARRGLLIPEARLHANAIGSTPEQTVAELFPVETGASRDLLLEEVAGAERSLEFTVMPGAHALVRRLSAARVPLGIVTSASRERAHRAVEMIGLPDAFGATVTWGEAAAGKPSPDPYLLGAERLGVESGRTLVFEDSAAGVSAAVAAGAYCVGLGSAVSGQSLLSSGAGIVVSGLTEVGVQRGDNAAGAGYSLAVGCLTIALDNFSQQSEKTPESS